MFYVFFSIFSLCALKSFYWYTFNVINLFFHGFLCVVNTILYVFQPQKFHWGLFNVFHFIPCLFTIPSTFLITHIANRCLNILILLPHHFATSGSVSID